MEYSDIFYKQKLGLLEQAELDYLVYDPYFKAIRREEFENFKVENFKKQLKNNADQYNKAINARLKSLNKASKYAEWQKTVREINALSTSISQITEELYQDKVIEDPRGSLIYYGLLEEEADTNERFQEHLEAERFKYNVDDADFVKIVNDTKPDPESIHNILNAILGSKNTHLKQIYDDIVEKTDSVMSDIQSLDFRITSKNREINMSDTSLQNFEDSLTDEKQEVKEVRNKLGKLEEKLKFVEKDLSADPENTKLLSDKRSLQGKIRNDRVALETAEYALVYTKSSRQYVVNKRLAWIGDRDRMIAEREVKLKMVEQVESSGSDEIYILSILLKRANLRQLTEPTLDLLSQANILIYGAPLEMPVDPEVSETAKLLAELPTAALVELLEEEGSAASSSVPPSYGTAIRPEEVPREAPPIPPRQGE